MAMVQMHIKKYRTLFFSDIHLGAKGCQAEQLLSFLKVHNAERIYLVGDIIDFWRIRKKAHWPQSHNDVIQKLLRKVRKGTRLFIIPGNHDEGLRNYCGNHFGGIEILDRAIHKTADGRRFLILHGDEFDVVVCYARWLAQLGDSAYETSVILNKHLNHVRRRLGLPYWSLSAMLKRRVKTAVKFIGKYETALVGEARRRQVDGIICGHIHHAVIRRIDGIDYVNTGDWVESCTAIGETFEGRLEMIRWLEAGQAGREDRTEMCQPVTVGDYRTAARGYAS